MEGQLGGSEVRKLHIIYFLSHMGRAEQPHLIRVHHLTRTGVYLRDVKRWLGDLRGKEMPEAYAWSYKRRYKTGYVWQDLLNDDLITPLSDNEYVLKGSEYNFSSNYDEKVDISHQYSCAEPRNYASATRTDKTCIEKEKLQPQDSQTDSVSKIFSEINEEESSSFGTDRSSLTDEFEPIKFEADKHLATNAQDKPIYHKVDMDIISTYGRYSPSKDRKSKPKAKALTGGASSVFRNFIPCGAVETNDTVVVTSRRNGTNNDIDIRKGQSFKNSCDPQMDNQKPQRQSGSSARKSHYEKKDWTEHQTKFAEQRATRPIARPVGEPNCSQCGKAFKPAKLHSHMKSCRGMKASVNSSICGSFVDKRSVSHHSRQGYTNSMNKEPALANLITK